MNFLTLQSRMRKNKKDFEVRREPDEELDYRVVTKG